jgi:hypothetical protein
MLARDPYFGKEFLSWLVDIVERRMDLSTA